jgi:hypothetical protein
MFANFNCRCVPVLQHLTFITPNANELLTIAAAVQHQQQQQQQQQQHTPSSSHAAAAAQNSSSLLQPSALEQMCCPQQLLAQLVPAATTVLSQGTFGGLLFAAGCYLYSIALHISGSSCQLWVKRQLCMHAYV